MITYEMKDRVLKSLVEFGVHSQLDVHDATGGFGFSSDYLVLILNQFEDLGFLSQQKCLGGVIIISLTADSFDFWSHGGFQAQEELLKKNIEKLLLEIESLKPFLPDKVNTLTAIAANIATALGLFLTR